MEIIKDTLPMDIKMLTAAEEKAARNHGLPVFKGRLFKHDGPMDQNLDEFGNPIFDFVNENTVVIGGAITALQHIFGVHATWAPATLNGIYGINDTQFSEFDCRVKLFGVGLGGCGMEFGPVNDPDFKQREIIDMIPFRISDTDTLEAVEEVANKYYFRRSISDSADNPQYGWFLKEFEKPVEITSLWKDTVDPTEDGTEIVSDELAINGPTLLGDLVDCLEARYATAQLPVYTADFEIGTGEFPIMSPIYKRMDMGDARYDLINYGKINPQTWANLTESWYPSDVRWRVGALERAHILFKEMFDELTKKVQR